VREVRSNQRQNQTLEGAPANAPLDARAWVETAFDALAVGGIEAVRVDRLAKTLGVSRGSFYWHFKDRAALHMAMLKEWRRRASFQVFVRLERAHGPVGERIQRLLSLPQAGGRAARAANIELAVRLWARQDPRAADAVADIDRRRLHYFESLFRRQGAGEEAQPRAFLLYSYLMGQALMGAGLTPALFRACEALLAPPPNSDSADADGLGGVSPSSS